MRNKSRKIMSIFMIILLITIIPLQAEQTLGELENEIAQIKKDTEKKLAEKEQVEAEKLTTESDIEGVKAEMDSVKSQITQKQNEIVNKQNDIAVQNGKIEEIQQKIPKVKEKADTSLQVLQKATNSNIMIELVIAPTENEEDNILRRINSVNLLAEYAGEGVIELVEIERQLQYEKTVLEREEAELEASEAELEVAKQELSVKEQELKEVLQNQTDAAEELDTSVEQAAEDQAMLEDTLAYYQSYGCSEDDIVGSKCGGLGDDDGDGVINNDDVCPNEYGTQSDGCPKPEVPDSGGGSSGGSGGGSSGGSGGGSSGGFIRPLSTGVVTCNWGCYGGHTGMDLDNRDYDPVYSTSDGVVITARTGCDPFYPGVNSCNGGYGNYVMIMHNTSSGTVFSLYGHLASLSVSQGQYVSQGQKIGLLGDSGNSSGSHLHFEVFPDANGNGLPDDYRSNPRNYVSFPPAWTWW